MTPPRSLLRTAAEIVFIGLPGIILFHLWARAIAEQLGPEAKSAA